MKVEEVIKRLKEFIKEIDSEDDLLCTCYVHCADTLEDIIEEYETSAMVNALNSMDRPCTLCGGSGVRPRHVDTLDIYPEEER